MDVEEFRKFYFEELRWCACGDPESALVHMRDVLSAIHIKTLAINLFSTYGQGEDPPELAEAREAVRALVGFPDRTGEAYSYLYVLGAVKLVEHGSNIDGCWLAPKGEEVLAFLLANDIDELLDD